jgi:hypothetical protein
MDGPYEKGYKPKLLPRTFRTKTVLMTIAVATVVVTYRGVG